MDEQKTEEIKIDKEKTIEEKKEKAFEFLKKTNVWVVVFLIIALILGIYTRSLPMMDHTKGIPTLTKFISSPFEVYSGTPGLWDITTKSWTLGPDLDPWLFERYAKTMVQTGSLPSIDKFRNYPLGFDTSVELQMVSYNIVLVYKLVNLFGNFPVEFAADLNPVIMFLLTIIAFFLFVREVFARKTKESKTRANIIALISTFFMIVAPDFLSRTVAGIPEKEANGFVFMFLAFYLFLKAWKSEKNINSIIFAILAGISTLVMGLTWGGVIYINIAIVFSCFVAFILGKFRKKEFIVYAIWISIITFLTPLFTSRGGDMIISVKNSLTSIDTGLGFFLLFTIIIDWALWKSNKINIKALSNSKLPKNILSLIVSFVLLVIIASLLLGPSFFMEKLKAINAMMFHPITGRWSTTVAENRQPNFQEWSSSFGPFIQKIPTLFWLFFIGSVVLFKKTINKINKKDSWILTGFFVLFLLGLIFSRYSSASIFNGENFTSKAFYYGSALLFICSVIYFYIQYYKKGNKSFEEIEYEYILLFLIYFVTLFTARSAVRLIMVLVPIAPIFLAYLNVESIIRFRKSEDETAKILMGIFVIVLVLSSLFVFTSEYRQITAQSYGFVPSMYNQQWQEAMQWVRNETPANAVFAHWWDYGYWVQSIGNRATVTDGGNAITYWNYLMGRLVLTGDNQKDSLDFLYSHNASYLLIDSSDIGKYGAFSSIGSNKNYDRYSWIGDYLLDDKQTQETSNQTLYVYTGGVGLDEDLVINENGRDIILPSQKTGVGAIVLPVKKDGSSSNFGQPYVILVYQGIQHNVNLRYLSVNDNFMDFKTGIEATAFIYPRLIQDGQNIGQNPIGAAMFISPRLMRGYLAQKYILNDPLKKFPNFKIAHIEDSPVVKSLESQGMQLPDFIYYQGVQGPIKIWKIEYTGREQVKQEYLDTNYAKYLDWEL